MDSLGWSIFFFTAGFVITAHGLIRNTLLAARALKSPLPFTVGGIKQVAVGTAITAIGVMLICISSAILFFGEI